MNFVDQQYDVYIIYPATTTTCSVQSSTEFWFLYVCEGQPPTPDREDTAQTYPLGCRPMLQEQSDRQIGKKHGCSPHQDYTLFDVA